MSDQQDTEYRYADAILPAGGIHTGVRTDHVPSEGRIEARRIPARVIDGDDTTLPERIAVEFRTGGGTVTNLIFTPEQWRVVIGLVQELMPADADDFDCSICREAELSEAPSADVAVEVTA